jgi:spore maturation protein CgeB
LSDLEDKIKKITEDNKLKNEMTTNNLEKIKNHHFTEMAHVIFNTLKKISNKNN